MGRCLIILSATLALVALLTIAGLPRIAPSSGPGPGALVTADYVIMCGVPIGAFAAGRHWYRYELFLLYGGFGLALFVPAFLADRNNHNKIYTTNTADHAAIDAILHDTAAWTIAMVAMAVACMFIGRWARRRFPVR
jgi:hypothetical protein